MKRSHSRSPLRSKVYADCDVLHIRNTPPFWNMNRVKQFIIESSKSKAVIEGIKNIIILKGDHNSGSCLVKFVNSFACNLALTELPGTVCNGKKIEVSLDIGNLYQEENKQIRQEIYKRGAGFASRKTPQSLQQNNNQQMQDLRPLLQISLDNMSKQFDSQEEFETYGLSKNFLKVLNIKPPLLNKIFIGNLDPKVDEAKLREIFSYAGQVMQIILISKDKQRPSAKIEFDHPVEAVQAISMFNNQELYNKPMLVQMDTSPYQYNNIPKGLKGFGPGLGVDGEPLRGVRTHLELQPLKNLLTEEINKLKERTAPSKGEQPVTVNPGQVDSNMIDPFNTNTVPAVVNMNPFIQTNPLLNLSGLVNPQGLQNLQMLQNLLQQNSSSIDNNQINAITLPHIQKQLLHMQGNVQQNTGTIVTDWSSTGTGVTSSRQTDLQSRSDTEFNQHARSNSYDDVYRNVDDREIRNRGRWDRENDDEKSQISTSDMLVFNNLPPSVSVQALNSKMREVGDVKFVELTGYGRALVRFHHVRDAERCVKLFHESKVDGKTIEVRFF